MSARRLLLVLIALLVLPSFAFAQPMPAVQPAVQPGQPGQPEVLPPAPEEEPEPEDPPLPKLDEMKLPEPEELLKGDRIDWVVLKENLEVLVVQPVFPRPGTLEKMEKRIEDSYKITPKDAAERERFKKQREEWKNLIVLLPGDDVTEYKLHMDQIEKVIHHEDLVLERVERLIEGDDLRGAYELLFPLVRRVPDWPGVEDTQNSLLLGQAKRRLKEDRLQEALVYIEELFDRSKNFPGVRTQMAITFDALIGEAVDAVDFRRARYFLARLRKRLPEDEIVTAWIEDLDGRATTLADRAREATAAGDHDRAAVLVDEAAGIWPASEGLRELHRAAINRWQRLVVGVRRAGSRSYDLPVTTLAHRRHLDLVTTPLFEVATVDYRTVYRHRDVEAWVPTDLGRAARFTMRRDRERWESLDRVTASEITASLERRLDPNDPTYDERLAAYVASVRVDSPFRFEVRFRRTPLRPEAMLEVTTPTRLAGDQHDGGRRGRFHVHEADGESVVYRRSIPEPDGLKPTEYHVAEIEERSYPTWDAAAQGLLRDEVDVVTHVRPYDVDRIAADKRFEIRRYALPQTHVLQFNWETPVLRNQSFRRSLAFATNASRVMREVVLRSETSPYGRLVTAPWASDSLYYAKSVDPRENALGLSIALRLVAKKELGTLPELTLLVVGDDVAVEAAHEIVKDWKRTGLAARVVTEEEYAAMPDPRWDVLYRTVKMPEPLVQLWPFLVTKDTARVEDLELLPDWLRARLLELDRVTSWRDAEARLRRLQADLYEDARYIPLWEVDDHYVIRNTLRPASSAASRPVSVYDDIERWIVRPRYPTTDPSEGT